jgi:hypothetical protein
MSRPYPVADTSCDGCGASEEDNVVVYDYTSTLGEFLCGECADEPAQPFTESVKEFASKLDRLPQEIKDMSGVPSAVTKMNESRKAHALKLSRDKLMEERDQANEALARLANQMEFHGNSVQHWYDKAKAYGNIVFACTPALEKAGYKYTPSPQGPKRFIANSVEALVNERDKNLDNLAKYGSHHQRCAWHDTPLVGVDCDCGLREALGQPIKRPMMWECECGNRYSTEFFNAKVFNCFCCGKELIGI